MYHFSPRYSLPLRFLDGVAYGQGKSDTPVLAGNLATLFFKFGRCRDWVWRISHRLRAALEVQSRYARDWQKAAPLRASVLFFISWWHDLDDAVKSPTSSDRKVELPNIVSGDDED